MDENDTLLLIAGDSFGIKDHEIIEKERAKLIFDVYDAMGAAAYGLGELDLLYGVEFLQELASTHTIGILCANIADKKLSSNPFKSHVVVEKGGKRLLITAVVGAQINLHDDGESLGISDPVAAIRNIRKRVDHDLFIVMAYVNQATAEIWARKVDGIDLMVIGDQAGIRTRKKMVNGTMIVFSNVKGSALSYVDVKHDDKKGNSDFSSPINQTIVAQEYEESPLVKAMIDEFKDNASKKLRNRQSKGRADLEMAARDGFFVGDQWCIRCHREIYDSWKTTRHAHAMETLEKAGKADDPECLKCHTTGMNNKNMWFARARAGFSSMETTPYLANVQCEACHGPAQQHSIKPEQYTFPKLGPQNCKRCHTSIRDADFAYIRDKGRGTHQMGTGSASNESGKNEAPSK